MELETWKQNGIEKKCDQFFKEAKQNVEKGKSKIEKKTALIYI